MPAATIKSALIYLFAVLAAAMALYAFWSCQGRTIALPEVASSAHKLQCVSYSPFDKEQSPLRPGFIIKPERMDADLALLAQYFSCVRTYSMTGLEELPVYAQKHGLKVMLGAWVSSDVKNTHLEIEQLVTAANRYPDVVQSVVVGNEALLRKDISGARLAELITEVKGRVKQPVTYADVWEFWLKYPQVAPAVDFVTIHLLPYWEDEPTGIDRALEHVAAVREEYGRLFSPKDILIGETGWPSNGRQRETAVPSLVNQAKFMRGFIALAEHNGWNYNLIEAFDQPWKRINEGAVGGYWGLFDADRHDKHILAGSISNLPDWQQWLRMSAIIALGTLLLIGWPRDAQAAVLAPALALIAGICIALWLLQAVNDNRDYWEWAWTFLLIAINLFALLRAIPELVQRHSWRRKILAHGERYASYGLLSAGFVGAVLMAQLVFDARYREFSSYIILLPALIYLRWPSQTARRESLFLCAVIALGIPLQLFEERLTNTQALGWAAASALLAASLWRSSRTSRSPEISAANTASATV
ncbi:MAG TPA: glycosyl hydrolase family 17 protein [Spongiibacteraceae bacterium]